ncbi:MAG: NADPH:quinone oxidoreductase family protein [Acidimicrobiales bacterium]
MRAWRVLRHGDPSEVLALEDGVPLPAPEGDQIEIEIAACALNFADDLLCRGTYQERPPLPFTPGLEVAGTVTAVGPAATHSVGDRVAGSPLLPHGGLAERCLARSVDVFPIPASMPEVVAAAMHVTYQTGWFALHRRARLEIGETLLVHAGAGGVGSAAIQLGKAAGSRVIATAGGAEKTALCRQLGADVTVDTTCEDFVAVVNELTGGLGAEVIFDPVGGETFTGSTRCIAWEGRIVVIGAAGGRYAEARTNHVLVKNYSILGLNWGGYRTRRPELVRAAHEELIRLHADGLVEPLISEVVALAEARDALAALTARRTTGKIVVTPGGSS